VAHDEAVVALARRAARPVLTTHAGPGHLVAHERTGVVTYDNPGSVVWGTSRLLDDPVHTERMGQNGKQAADDGVPGWSLVARHYADVCAEVFPALAQGPR
jgi:hypothetical protein